MMIRADDTGERRASLAKDEGLRHLIESLALAEPPHFSVLVCPDRITADIALSLIEEGVASRRGSDVNLHRFDWSEDDAALGRLVASILQPLIQWPSDGDGSDLFAMVISNVGPANEEGWFAFFQRMNEVRNHLMDRLPGPLVLIIPSRLATAFAHRAPDFWSIRSVFVQVKETLSAQSGRSIGSMGNQDPAVIKAGIEPELTAPITQGETSTIADFEADPEDVFTAYHAAREIVARGDASLEKGRVKLAGRDYRRALAILEKLAGRDESRSDWQRALSVVQERMGDYFVAAGDLAGAEAAYRQVLDRREDLLEKNPTQWLWHRERFVVLVSLGDVLVARGNLDGALQAFNQSLSLMETVVRQDSKRVEWQRDIWVSLIKIGDVYMAKGEAEQAVASYRKSWDLIRGLLEEDPDNAERRRDHAVLLERIGDASFRLGKLAEAVGHYRTSLAMHQKRLSASPASRSCLIDVSVAHRKLGDVLAAQGEWPRSLEAFQASLTICENLVHEEPENRGWQRDLGVAQEKVGDILSAMGETEKAREAYQSMLGIREALVGENPLNPVWQRDLVGGYERMWQCCQRLGQNKAAGDYRKRLLATLRHMKQNKLAMDAELQGLLGEFEQKGHD